MFNRASELTPSKGPSFFKPSNKKVLFHLAILIFMIFFHSISLAQESISPIVKKVNPTVVLIATYDQDSDFNGQGTGFFISPSEIVTNYHVIQNAYSAIFKTSKEESFLFKEVLASDQKSDLAQLSNSSYQ
jgi:S1-C subfamily serine protease